MILWAVYFQVWSEAIANAESGINVAMELHGYAEDLEEAEAEYEEKQSAYAEAEKDLAQAERDNDQTAIEGIYLWICTFHQMSGIWQPEK